MNEIVKLYKDNPVRIIEKDGEPWFVAKDVCDILDFGNPYSRMAFYRRVQKNFYPQNEVLNGTFLIYHAKPEKQMVMSCFAFCFQSAKFAL